jgi:Fe-Mn family superoxide dismutase
LPGHINHSLFWTNLAPAKTEGKGNGGILPDGPLKNAINASFGSFENFKKEFTAATLGIQGSGWGWLVSLSNDASFFVFFVFLPWHLRD